MIWALVIACGTREPDWVEGCDCPDGELCVSSGVAACLAPPEACAAAFEGSCDLDLVDDACTAEVCGFSLEDSGVPAGVTIAAECWERDGVVERHVDCDATPTF